VEATTNEPQVFTDCSTDQFDRSALATHPTRPYLLAVAAKTSGDVCIIDTRVPPGAGVGTGIGGGGGETGRGNGIRFIRELHGRPVREIEWISDDKLITAAHDGHAKIIHIDGTILHDISADTGTGWTAGVLSVSKWRNEIVLGGSGSVYVFQYPPGEAPTLHETLTIGTRQIWRLKHNQRGSLLAIADDTGCVRLYRRTKNADGVSTHVKVADILEHKADVEDCDISISGEYIVSASQDRTVGLATIDLKTL